jgi:hypothetical protein
MKDLGSLPTAAELIAEMERALQGEQPHCQTPWVRLLVELVQSNLRQWELEDSTRDPFASDAVVANAKRDIDRLNSRRHHLMEEIDSSIDASLDQLAAAPFATESPGMVLDRLSVLVIRRARTASASLNQPLYAQRMLELESRLATLASAFDSYVDELLAGSRRFLPYQPFKLYGSSAPAAD